MEKCFTIISGGQFSPLNDIPPASFIIACDRGYEYAVRCGIKPDLIVGDFDSCSVSTESGIPVERFRKEKDDTDTMIAVRHAVENGCTRLDMRCALGGRLDHLLANIQAAVYAAQNGAAVHIADESTEIYVVPPCEMSLDRREGFSLSLLAASDECTGVCISGVKYPLSNARISNSFPIGVSNEWRAPSAKFSFSSGILMIIMSKM